jgi:ABC-type transport system involved in cytochrome c biogenesis permease subunit
LLSGISIVCFASSYAVAFGLELLRTVFRGRVRGALVIAFATAGFVAHTLYLGYRAASTSSLPLSSAYEWFLLAAWALAAIYLYLAFFQPSLSAIGVFLLPLALALIAASHYASQKPVPLAPAKQVWGIIHGVFLLAGAVVVIVGFVAGAAYLWQSYRLKQKLPPLAGIRLPSLELLERVNSRAIVLSALLVGAGVLSGFVLNLIYRRQGHAESLPWTDPIVWRSAGMFAWLLAAVAFTWLYRPARRGRKVAYLTVASFVFLAIFLAAQLIGTGHDFGGGKSAASSARRHTECACHVTSTREGRV